MKSIFFSRTGIVAILVVLHVASSAHAVGWTVLSPTGPIPLPVPFSVITIDIALDNLPGDSVQGVSGTLSGLAAAGVTVIGGQSAQSHFISFCSSTACFGGASTVDNAFFNPNDLGASGAYTPGEDSIVIVSAVSVAGPTTATGELDPGLDGGFDVPSARDVTISLLFSDLFLAPQSIMLGGSYSDGVNIFTIPEVQVFTFTPEPGAALLIGLGLAGLGANRPKTARVS